MLPGKFVPANATQNPFPGFSRGFSQESHRLILFISFPPYAGITKGSKISVAPEIDLGKKWQSWNLRTCACTAHVQNRARCPAASENSGSSHSSHAGLPPDLGWTENSAYTACCSVSAGTAAPPCVLCGVSDDLVTSTQISPTTTLPSVLRT